MSAASGQGLDRLADLLKGRISVVAGPSGVGKSSLINALKLQAANLSTGDESPASADQQNGAAATSNGSCSEAASSEGHCLDRLSSMNGSTSRVWDAESITERGKAGAALERVSVSQGSASQEEWKLAEMSTASGGVAVSSPVSGDAADDSRGEVGNSAGQAGGRAASESSGDSSQTEQRQEPVLEPVERWRGMQAAAEKLGLQPVGDLTNIGRGKHTTRHVSLLEVCAP